IGFGAVERKEHGGAERYKFGIGGKADTACHRHAECTERTRSGELAKEDPAWILVHYCRAAHRVGAQIVEDALHRRLPGLKLAAVTQQLAYADIVAAVLAVVADAHDAAVRKPQTPRALHLEEEEFRSVRRPCDFEPASFERAALDLRPVVIGDETAAFDAPPDLLAQQRLRKEPEVNVDQIGRPAIDRNVIARLLRPRGGYLGLEIAGDEGGARPHLHRAEIAAEEIARVLIGPACRRSAAFGPFAGLGQAARIGPALHRRAAEAE